MIPHRTMMAAARPGYRDLVLADEPYAYYRLEHTTGDVAADETPARRDATCRGAVQLGEPGLVAGSAAAVRLGAAGAYLDLPFALDPDEASVTCELWILTPATLPSAGRQTLLAQRDDGPGVGRSWLYIDAGNHDGLGAGSLNTGLAEAPSETGIVIAAATRYHLVLELTAQAWQLYVNGEPSKRGELSPQPAGAFVLGIDNSLSENPFQGVIDEIAFYAETLGAARIKAHYEAGA